MAIFASAWLFTSLMPRVMPVPAGLRQRGRPAAHRRRAARRQPRAGRPRTGPGCTRRRRRPAPEAAGHAASARYQATRRTAWHERHGWMTAMPRTGLPSGTAGDHRAGAAELAGQRQADRRAANSSTPIGSSNPPAAPPSSVGPSTSDRTVDDERPSSTQSGTTAGDRRHGPRSAAPATDRKANGTSNGNANGQRRCRSQRHRRRPGHHHCHRYQQRHRDRQRSGQPEQVTAGWSRRAENRLRPTCLTGASDMARQLGRVGHCRARPAAAPPSGALAASPVSLPRSGIVRQMRSSANRLTGSGRVLHLDGTLPRPARLRLAVPAGPIGQRFRQPAVAAPVRSAPPGLP